MNKESDLTVGNPTSTLITFAIPFFIANLLQAIYGAVDLLIVGRFSQGAASTAAVANGSQILMLFTLFIMGFTTGATVLIGRYYGAKDMENMRKTVSTMLLCFFISAGIITLLMLSLTPWLVRMLNTPPDVVEETCQYVYICSCGVVFIFGYNVFSAILRGVGNSTWPMIFIGIACVINIISDLVLVGHLKMGPAGAAYATIFSQGVSMICALVYVRRQKNLFAMRLRNLRIYSDVARKLFQVGLPLAIQSTIIDISFMMIFAIINKFGAQAAAGYGICCRLNGFILLPAISLGMAMTPIIAQNLGASKPQRALQFFRLSVLYATGIGIFMFCWMQFWPHGVFSLFNRDEAVIHQGILYMRSFCFEVLVLGFVFSANGFLNGSGHTRFTMVNNLIPTFLVRVPATWLVSLMPGVTLYEIGFAAPLASLFSIFVTVIYLRTGRWRINRF